MSIDRAILYDKVLTRRDIAAIDSQLLLDVSFSMVRVKNYHPGLRIPE
jgi:hypothetical protein